MGKSVKDINHNNNNSKMREVLVENLCLID